MEHGLSAARHASEQRGPDSAPACMQVPEFRCGRGFLSEASYERRQAGFPGSPINGPPRKDPAHRRAGIGVAVLVDDNGHRCRPGSGARRRQPAPTDRAEWIHGPSDRRPGRAHRRRQRAAGRCTTRWSICSPGRACWARPLRCVRSRARRTPLIDSLSAVGSGFGGDPEQLRQAGPSTRARSYEFSGLFRRDRQYFDYDLLGNPNIPSGQSIPIGPTARPPARLAWPQVNQSAFLFNTVRRMTDTNLTFFPLAKVSYRVGYSQNIFEGPSLSPSGYQFASSYDACSRSTSATAPTTYTGGGRLEARAADPADL